MQKKEKYIFFLSSNLGLEKLEELHLLLQNLLKLETIFKRAFCRENIVLERILIFFQVSSEQIEKGKVFLA